VATVVNELQIVASGREAAANAKAGGILLNPTKFKIGRSAVAVKDTDEDLLDIIFTGDIVLVDFVTKTLVRFVIDIPKNIPGVDDAPGSVVETTIGEVGIFLDSDIMLARGILKPTIVKNTGIGLRIYALAECTVCSLDTVLNVNVGSLESIPTTPHVFTLPDPATSLHNAIGVLDLKHNDDNSYSAALAIRYGPGAKHWSFEGYSRVYAGKPDSGTVISNSSTHHDAFRLLALSSGGSLKDNDAFIVQVISGPGIGQTRRFYYDATSNLFVEYDGKPYAALSNDSFLNIWRATTGTGTILGDHTCEWPPQKDETIPADWVLTRGASCPVWAPQKTVALTPVLYYEPGSLRVSVLHFTGTGRDRVYDTPLDPQNLDAYDIEGSLIIFSEEVPPGISIEVEVYTLRVGSGGKYKMNTYHYIGDGVTKEFAIGTDALSAGRYARCVVGGFKQHTTAYTYDTDTNKIVFTEAPYAGVPVMIITIVQEAAPGYSTRMLTNTFIARGDPNEVFTLSTEPEGAAYVVVSASGFIIHNDRFSVSGNSLIMADVMPKGLPIRVTIFKNHQTSGIATANLPGVVVDGVVTNKYLTLIRHGAPDVQLPLPKLELKEGPGIEITGEYPNLTIRNKLVGTAASKRAGVRRYSNLYTNDDVEELIFTYKFDFDVDTEIMLTADFAARLGPGFYSENGAEMVEYVLGFKTVHTSEPPYGRRAKGTGVSGFSYLQNGNYAYSNASLTQTFELVKDNLPINYVTFVAKMRIRNGNISRYKSQLDINFSLLASPKYLG
jgi:hypothetical protein